MRVVAALLAGLNLPYVRDMADSRWYQLRDGIAELRRAHDAKNCALFEERALAIFAELVVGGVQFEHQGGRGDDL